ncbi:hypothetical protein B0J17DRAFT_710822 [Rhizoctonia solani]|nr:hypothetical protein B0J17DRAFT_710822 [Rhizoctonia solani]
MSLVSIPQRSGGELQFVPYTIFPNPGMRILSAIIHFLGSSTLAYCIALRIRTARMASINELKALSWPRFCILMILVVSWMFIVGTGILIHGIGLSSSQDACSSGLFMCIWLYALTKVFIYAFLTEKVRVVWDIVAQPRLSSPVYLICLLVMLPFAAMPIMMTIGRIAFFRSDMSCILGLKPFSSIALLGYDLFTNVFLNAMFLWPLLRSRLINLQLRAVARRTLVAAVAALATSITNVAVLTVLKHELGWVWLGSCATDVTLNALVIFWLTMPTAECSTREPVSCLVQPLARQQSSSQIKPDTGHIAQISTLPKSTIGTFTPIHKPRSPLNAKSFSKPADIAAMNQQSIPETHEIRYTTTLSEFPVSSTAVSASVGNISILATLPGDESNSERRSVGLRSFGEFFGISKPKLEQDMEVHVSVVTQHDVELGELGIGGARQGDGDGLDQTKLASEWYK